MTSLLVEGEPVSASEHATSVFESEIRPRIAFGDDAVDQQSTSGESESDSDFIIDPEGRDRTRNKIAEGFEKGFFGVVHMMIKGNALFAKLGIVTSILDFFRTIPTNRFILTFVEMISFSFPAELPIDGILDWWRTFTTFFQFTLYSEYTIWLRVFIAALVLITIAAINCIYVGYAFQVCLRRC